MTRNPGILDSILTGLAISEALELLFEDSLYTQAIRSAGLTGGYGRWVDKQIQAKMKADGRVNLSFVTSTINLVKKFVGVQKNIKGNKDIFSYKTVEDLKKAIHDSVRTNPQDTDPTSARSNPGLKLLHDSSEWELFSVLNHRALCSVGSRTSWCVVADKDHYDRYVKGGAKLYLLRTHPRVTGSEVRRYLIARFPGGDLEIANERNEHLSADKLSHEVEPGAYDALSKALWAVDPLIWREDYRDISGDSPPTNRVIQTRG